MAYPIIKIITKNNTLSDMSTVYDVFICQDAGQICIPAISQKDAEAMVFALSEIIVAHSNETVVEGF